MITYLLINQLHKYQFIVINELLPDCTTINFYESIDQIQIYQLNNNSIIDYFVIAILCARNKYALLIVYFCHRYHVFDRHVWCQPIDAAHIESLPCDKELIYILHKWHFILLTYPEQYRSQCTHAAWPYRPNIFTYIC